MIAQAMGTNVCHWAYLRDKVHVGAERSCRMPSDQPAKHCYNSVLVSETLGKVWNSNNTPLRADHTLFD